MLRPGIRQPAGCNEAAVGEAAQERHEIRLLLGRDCKAADPVAARRTEAPVSRIGSARDQPPTARVMVDHVLERAHASIMHVGKGEPEVAKRRDAHAPHVGLNTGDLEQAAIALGIAHSASCSGVSS